MCNWESFSIVPIFLISIFQKKSVIFQYIVGPDQKIFYWNPPPISKWAATSFGTHPASFTCALKIR